MAYQLWTSLRTGDRRKGVTFNEVRNKFIDYLTTKFISFLGKSLSTLHTNEKLFFEKGSIASGPSFKKN